MKWGCISCRWEIPSFTSYKPTNTPSFIIYKKQVVCNHRLCCHMQVIYAKYYTKTTPFLDFFLYFKFEASIFRDKFVTPKLSPKVRSCPQNKNKTHSRVCTKSERLMFKSFPGLRRATSIYLSLYCINIKICQAAWTKLLLLERGFASVKIVKWLVLQ